MRNAANVCARVAARVVHQDDVVRAGRLDRGHDGPHARFGPVQRVDRPGQRLHAEIDRDALHRVRVAGL
jgi:hypothetical protein